MRTLVAVLLAGSVLASGCGGDDPEAPSAGTSTSTATPTVAGPEELPLGKALLALDAGATYRSPDGFAPRLEITVPGEGWNSTHRGADAFDVGQAVPGEDAALVVVAFMVPAEATVAEALTALEAAAGAAGATVTERGADEIRVSDGDGPLVESRDGGIALDAVPGGYVDIEGGPGAAPLLTVTWVPDAAHQAEADQLAGALTADVVEVRE